MSLCLKAVSAENLTLLVLLIRVRQADIISVLGQCCLLAYSCLLFELSEGSSICSYQSRNISSLSGQTSWVTP